MDNSNPTQVGSSDEPTKTGEGEFKAGESEIKEAIRIQLEPKIAELDDKVKEVQSNTIQQLGIFVAFFTFVSIEFKLAQNFEVKQFLTFTPLFAALLLLFVLAIHVFLRETVDWLRVKFAALLILIMLVIAFYLHI